MNPMIYVIILFFLIFSYFTSASCICIFVLLLATWFIWLYATPRHRAKVNESHTWRKYEELLCNKQIGNTKLLHVYKAPKQITYIKMHRELMKELEQLKFLLRFQPEILKDVLIMIERFLHIHYNTMLNKYDAVSYIPVMQDIQKELLRTLGTYVFNLPKVSTTLYIDDIDIYLQRKTKFIHAFTDTLLKTVMHKFNIYNYNMYKFDEFVSPYDSMQEPHTIV